MSQLNHAHIQLLLGMALPSRRERIATAAPISFELAMRLYGDGNLLRLYGDGDRAAFFAHWASLSREWADALIAELDKEK